MKTDRERDWWQGPVKKVVTERASFFEGAGRWVLGQRELDYIATYDRDGKRIDESYGENVLFGSMLPVGSSTRRQDAEGNTVRHEEYDDYGSLLYTQIFRYDDTGKKIEEVSYNTEGTITGRVVYNYDVQGRPVEMLKYEAGGLLISKIAYTNEYDANGNVVRITVERWTHVGDEVLYDPICVIYNTITYY